MIKTVKLFNQEGHRKFREAVERRKPGVGGFPCLAMYLFLRENGEERKNGYVVSDGNSHSFFKNYERAYSIEEGLRRVK